MSFQILNFSFLKISLCVTSLTIDKFKLKNYIKLKKKTKKKTSLRGYSIYSFEYFDGIYFLC